MTNQFQSLQRNVFRFNDPTAASRASQVPLTPPMNTNGRHHVADIADAASVETKAATLPRNAQLMAPPASAAPGRRTAIDLSTNDDYVMFSALSQSAQYGTYNVNGAAVTSVGGVANNVGSLKNG